MAEILAALLIGWVMLICTADITRAILYPDLVRADRQRNGQWPHDQGERPAGRS